jgi:PAS domain S-box-containing protein
MTLPHSAAFRYGFAVVAALLAAALRAGLTPLWGHDVPLITFYAAVMASAWLGGVGPGLTATLLSAVCAEYFWMNAPLGFGLRGAANVIALGMFVATGAFMSGLTGALHRAHRRQTALLAGAQAGRAEAEQGREAMARLGAIVRSAHDAIISKTLDGTITSWNSAAERMLGYAAAEAIGRSIRMIVPPDRLAEEDEILRRLRLGESIDHIETERLHKDGRRIPISLTLSPVRDANGRVVGASKIARDISERKQAEEELRQAHRQKDEFLAMLAHELRNPLGTIMGAASALLRYGDRPDLARRSVEIIDRQARQLARLVEDLLDLTRLASGKIVLHRAPLDLAAATEACIT